VERQEKHILENRQKFIHMNQDKSHDKEDRRSGTDRRHFSFAFHVPERRSGLDRRKNIVLEQRKKSSN
jgi:hypothetical protein